MIEKIKQLEEKAWNFFDEKVCKNAVAPVLWICGLLVTVLLCAIGIVSVAKFFKIL